jgi:hypothetical protein
VNGALAVTPAALQITAGNQSKTYGTTLNLGTSNFSQTGLVTANGDAISGVTLASLGAASSAGVDGGTPYAIVASNAIGTGLSNYTISYVNGALAVNPAALQITAGNQTKTYGTTLNLGTSNFSETGLVTANGDAISGVTLASLGAASSAGVDGGTPYAIVASNAAGTGLSNYTISYVNGALAVTPAALTYSVANASSIYGTLATLGAATLTGVLPSDSVGATVGAFSGSTPVALAPGTAPGTYTEKVTEISNANYVLAISGNTPGVLIIQPRSEFLSPLPYVDYAARLFANEWLHTSTIGDSCSSEGVAGELRERGHVVFGSGGWGCAGSSSP